METAFGKENEGGSRRKMVDALRGGLGPPQNGVAGIQ